MLFVPQLLLVAALLREHGESKMSLIEKGVCLVEGAGTGDGVLAATLPAGDELVVGPLQDNPPSRVVVAAGRLPLELHRAAVSGWRW